MNYCRKEEINIPLQSLARTRNIWNNFYSLFTLPPHFPLFNLLKKLGPKPRQDGSLDMGTPSSWPVSFSNRVTIPWHNNSSLDLLTCYVVSSIRLISVTLINISYILY